MAPKKGNTAKSNFDEERWNWVESFEEPLTEEKIHVKYLHQSFGIDATMCERGSCRMNCKKNPSCHNHLGEKFWSSEIKDSFWVDLPDPEEERKKEGSHVGLKNLGATCYVNTFLQLWFHNPDFQSAIFKWIPSEGYHLPEVQDQPNSKKLEDTKPTNEGSSVVPILEDLPSPTFGNSTADNICGNLQLLFALMKYSEKRYVDPTPFVQSLALQTDEQQDAQEFSKLFMSLLESTLANQHDSVKDLVQDQYGGQYAYETRCTVCGKVSKTESNFYELDLSIQGHVLLKECIKEFLKEEKLDGDNKYYCANCQIKQDATRRIVLQSLPRVLNLQLLKFVFDRNTGSKKKCNSPIRFPDILDMNDFIKLDDPSKGIYELTAVLIHCGLSAYSGHYVAHILDKKDEAWYRFNDETVEKMTGKKLELGKEDDPEDNAKAPKKAKFVKGQHFSKNAYMLVYTRKDEDAVESNEIQPPDFIQDHVATSNSLFEDWIFKMRKLMDAKIEEGHLRCKEVMDIYDSLQPDAVAESEWVVSTWLRKWLNEKENSVPPIDNTILMCKHGRFDCCKVQLSKRVSTKSADRLFARYGGLPRFRYDSLCTKCVYNQAKRIQFDARLKEDKKIINAAVKSNYHGNDGFWVGKASLRQWKQLAIAAQNFDVNEDENNEVDGVKPLEQNLDLQNRKEDLSNIEDKGKTVQSECSENTQSKSHDNGHGAPHGEQIKPQDDGENGVKISKLENEEANLDESMEENNASNKIKENVFNADAQCQEHGNLCIDANKRRLVPRDAWHCLKYYFKDCPEFHVNLQPCILCQEQSAKKQERKEIIRILANEMKNSLLDLYHNVSRPELDREAPFEVYAVCKYTIEDWRRFLRSVFAQQYGLIENSDLFCEHGKLLYDAEDFLNPGSNEDYVLLTENEWRIFSNFVPYDREIKLSNCRTNGDEKAHSFSISHESCDDCRKLRLIGEREQTTQFNNASIYVRKITDEKKHIVIDEETVDIEDDQNVLNYQKQNPKKRKLFEPAEGQRKSARHRIQRGEYVLKVDSSQTLKDVKVQLIPIFSVIPCDQHLSLIDGTPLEDDSLLLSDLGVLPGSVLLLRADEPTEKAPIEETVNSNGERKLEEGFKGTGLCGIFQTDRNTDS